MAAYTDTDAGASERKKDHIELAFRSRVPAESLDDRFYYEPLFDAHPVADDAVPFPFLGKQMQTPIWVSSMTGGTTWAKTINQNLARACGEFGMGMGLGSCRSLLTSKAALADFAVRTYMPEQPLYANLGVAQVEQLLDTQTVDRIFEMIHWLDADGLIIHINPMQEAMQPEGDRFKQSPLETIQAFLEVSQQKIPLIVKEVGQGMGPESLRALLRLPLAALDFGASGGTNFALLELLRHQEQYKEVFQPLAQIGHTAQEMAQWTQALIEELGRACRCQHIIASGGVRSFLDGYYLTQKIPLPAVYGQASAFLRHARGDYQELRQFVAWQVQGLQLAQTFLRVR
ncbi:MAG: isopentenyl-diphosphate delta-isomerase [Bernardetiaceae bacterium]